MEKSLPPSFYVKEHDEVTPIFTQKGTIGVLFIAGLG